LSASVTSKPAHRKQRSRLLFSPDSLYWRVNREWLISLAGPRAVLLELAHPLVAAGVEQYSNYRGDPFGRLYRTMKTMTEISFGDTAEASPALRHLNACHARVHGEWRDERVTPRGGGTGVKARAVPFDANDPHLKLWVWATLVDSVLRVYDRFVTPLAYADKRAYYADCVRLARLLGIPASLLPHTFTAFNLYMGTMLEGETLYVSSQAREVVNALFAPTLRGRATRAFAFVSIGLMPPRLRAEYGFSWSDANERLLNALGNWSRRLRPWIPRALAIHPKAFAQERKWQLAQSGWVKRRA